MIELVHDGKGQKALTKDIQFHPVTDQPVHLDFYRVTAKSIIEVGALNVVRYAIEVKCPAGEIPDNIEVDISAMEIGDSIHISSVKLPKNVKPSITDRDFTIATMQESRAAVEETDEEEGEEVAAGDVPTAAQSDDATEGEG